MTKQSSLEHVGWRKSSYSNGDGGSCLEVADGSLPLQPVRDSKDTTRAPLLFPADGWNHFVGAVKNGRFGG